MKKAELNQLKRLISYGYFPVEMPPLFNTIDFAKHTEALLAYTDIEIDKNTNKLRIKNNKNNLPYTKATKSCSYSVAKRQNGFRRYLDIINPYSFLPLGTIIAHNFTSIKKGINESKFNKTFSELSLSSINKYMQRNRMSIISDCSIDLGLDKKYIVQTDISEFYSSVYTHIIPWATEGKPRAKKKQGINDSIGNQIDWAIRKCQDNQTYGLAVGPDTSLLISELILSKIDMKFKDTVGIRYMDDYYFFCNTHDCAENVIVNLEKILKEFEFKINLNKTKIHKLPHEFNSSWFYELKRTFSFMMNKDYREKNPSIILEYFERIFSLQEEFRAEGVARYGISLIKSHFNKLALDRNEIILIQKLLLHSIKSAPSVIPIVFFIFEKIGKKSVDIKTIDRTMSFLIPNFINSNHINEICWALFFYKFFSIKLTAKHLSKFMKIDNPIVIIMLLDMINSNLYSASKKLNFSEWEILIKSPNSLFGRNWILAYELSLQNWKHCPKIPKYETNDFFNYLLQKRVSFYNSDLKAITKSKKPDKVFNPYDEDLDENIEELNLDFENIRVDEFNEDF